MTDKSEMEKLDEWARSIADKDWENVVNARSHVIRLAAEIVTKCCSKKDQEWRDIVGPLVEALRFYADKDNWDTNHYCPTIWSDGDIDLGKVASQVLAEFDSGK